jgi:hypothetical protein
MLGSKRIGVWFDTGLENALAVRAALGGLQAEYPGADWVLLGPRESLFLFEMDERISAYIPLRALEPRRPAQSRLSFFLEKRGQYKKLRGLQLDFCIGVSVTQIGKQFQHFLKLLNVSGRFICHDLSEFQSNPRPELQAGAQALALATQHYRMLQPHALKALLLLSDEPGPSLGLDEQWKAARNILAREGIGQVTTAVLCSKNKLLVRQLAQAHPDWLRLDLPQTMGFLAYADRVISFSPNITRICCEMGRSDRLVLVKKDS